jgi:DNA sulfur modification protein DndC
MNAIADLFLTLQEPEPRIEQQHMQAEPHVRAIASIERVLRAGHSLQLAWSSGKDSSCCVNLAFNAALNLLNGGAKCPTLHLAHADTGVENPVVRALADSELKKMREFAKAHNIPFQQHIGRPTLSTSFAPRVIGGRALPTFPSTGKSDCAVDWKVGVGERISRAISKAEEGSGKPVVTVIGTRSAESLARQINTADRKETAHEIWISPSGGLRLSPILDWSTDSVWEYLGEAAAGMHKSYSDFAELIDFYRATSGGECMIVADTKQPSGGCSARSGCHVCTKVKNDHSVEQMIASDPVQFQFLEPLLRFRNFIADTQFNWRLRNYIGRTIDENGCMAVKADQYSPEMCEQLLRYALAAQDEANRLGSPSRVSIVGLRELIAIDFYWSVRAWHPPFHALAIYFEHLAGNVQHAPIIKDVHRPSPAPVIGRLHVGGDWDEDASVLRPQGLRDPVWELFSESCGPSLRSSPKGKVFMDIEEAPEFTVDEEGASMFMEFEAERMVREYHAPRSDWTAAASIYLRYGCVTLGKGMSSMVDDMMRRSQWLQRHDLHGQRGEKDLLARCHNLSARQEVLFD